MFIAQCIDHMYCMMYSLYVHSMVQLPWITYIHRTICSLGLNYVWVLEGHGISVNILKALVHQISLDQFIQKWRLEVDNSSKCLWYRICKQDFRLESYLLKLPPRLRIPLSRFRCRNNILPIESGSYEYVERNLRFCDKCDMQALGDELGSSSVTLVEAFCPQGLRIGRRTTSCVVTSNSHLSISTRKMSCMMRISTASHLRDTMSNLQETSHSRTLDTQVRN